MSYPTCPHHPSMRMRLVPSGEPLFIQARSAFSNDKRVQRQKAKKEERLIYRCTFEGCPRVEPKPAAPEKYFCRIYRCKNEADPNRAQISDYICRMHYLKKNNNRTRARRQMEQLHRRKADERKSRSAGQSQEREAQSSMF